MPKTICEQLIVIEITMLEIADSGRAKYLNSETEKSKKCIIFSQKAIETLKKASKYNTAE
jgi:hypothetical protein